MATRASSSKNIAATDLAPPRRPKKITPTVNILKGRGGGDASGSQEMKPVLRGAGNGPKKQVSLLILIFKDYHICQ
jgi:hypothetical protein